MCTLARVCACSGHHTAPTQVNIINNFVRFSADGNLPPATVVVGDVAACNSRINIVDTILFPTLVQSYPVYR